MNLAHLTIFAISLLGFVALAIGTERYAPQLVGFKPTLRTRRVSWTLGWLLLALALVLAAVWLETTGIGITLWFGWLSLAGLALVFALPRWPWRQAVKPSPERAPRAKAAAFEEEPVRQLRHWIGWGLLTLTAIVFTGALLRVDTKPLDRDDALTGKIGPWNFTFAEADRDAPELVDMDVPLKAYRLRFCEACDLEILRAYLKVNRPRALRASGMAFEGSRWDRGVEIQLPSNLTGESELWLTVVGKDGSVHQVSWPMKAVSPATVAWFEKQEESQ